MDLGYCRPITFHRHEGNFKVSLDDGTEANISGKNDQFIPNDFNSFIGILCLTTNNG